MSLHHWSSVARASIRPLTWSQTGGGGGGGGWSEGLAKTCDRALAARQTSSSARSGGADVHAICRKQLERSEGPKRGEARAAA